MENDFPLKGKTVLVTRNKAQAASFQQKVEALGGKAVLTSLITFRRALPNDVAEQVREDRSIISCLEACRNSIGSVKRCPKQIREERNDEND